MTIKEIAKLSGVGVSTVSRYLNDGYVSQEKRKIIAKVIEENDYVPSTAAAYLRGKSVQIIIIVSKLDYGKTSEFLEGVIDGCQNNGLDATIVTVGFNEEKLHNAIKAAEKKKPFGIIVYRPVCEVKTEYKDIVVVDKRPTDYPTIWTDDSKAMYQLAIETIDKQKHERVLIVTKPLNKPDHKEHDKIEGILRACEEKNIVYDFIDLAPGAYDIFEGLDFIEIRDYCICTHDQDAYHIMAHITVTERIKEIQPVYLSAYATSSRSNHSSLTTVQRNETECGVLAVSMLQVDEKKSYEIPANVIDRKST